MIIIENIYCYKNNYGQYFPTISIQGHKEDYGVNYDPIKNEYVIRKYYCDSFYSKARAEDFTKNLKRTLYLNQFNVNSNYRLVDDIDIEINEFCELREILNKAYEAIENSEITIIFKLLE